MPKPTKAQITYQVEGEDQVIRFHGIISEGHEASSQITSFPTQAGFVVSNHAIKKNRKVTLEVMVTNSVIVGAEEGHTYGTNNVKVMFSTLTDLVEKGTATDVVTNYGNYKNVVFDRFRTKLVAGRTDSMLATLVGKEVKIGSATNSSGPTRLTFTVLTDEERAARVEELAAMNIIVPDEATISEAQVDLNESFSVDTINTAGEPMVMTYEKTGFDPTTNTHTHTCHTSDVEVATAGLYAETAINWNRTLQADTASSLVPDLAAGASTSIACLGDGLEGIANDVVEEVIETAVGELTDSVYGAVADVMALAGDSPLGQALFSLGIDCLVAGAVGSYGGVDETDFNDNELITVDQALEGAAKQGNEGLTEVVGLAAPTTLSKITPAGGGDVQFFGATP